VVLFPDLIAAASKVASRFPDWILLGGTWTLPSRLQASLLSRLQSLHSLLPQEQAQAQSQHLARTLFSSQSQPQPQYQTRSQSHSQGRSQSQSHSQSQPQYIAKTAQQRQALEEAGTIQALLRGRGRLKAAPAPGGPGGWSRARSLASSCGLPPAHPSCPSPCPFAMGRGASEEWLVHHLVYRGLQGGGRYPGMHRLFKHTGVPVVPARVGRGRGRYRGRG